jgi:hypothetical protein
MKRELLIKHRIKGGKENINFLLTMIWGKFKEKKESWSDKR